MNNWCARLCAVAVLVAGLSVTGTPAQALFLTFEGGVAEHAAFQTAAGPTALETFDGFAGGTQVSSLPGLGIDFGEIAPGLFPGIYVHGIDNTPSLPHQLSNMPTGFPQVAHQFADIVILATGAGDLNAFGYWNGDPQGNMVATAFDADDNILGSVSAAVSGGFAGFVTDGAVTRIVIGGNVGDGWNHVDDFETAFNLFTEIPAPASGAILIVSLVALAGLRHRRR